MIAAFMGLIVSGTGARAQSLLTLELTAPPGCPTSEAVVSAVGRLVHAAPREPIRAVARIERRPNDYALNLTLDGGERQVAGASCLELSQTLALILALAIDPAAKTDASRAFSPVSVDSSPATPGQGQPSSAPERPPEIAPSPRVRPATQRDTAVDPSPESTRSAPVRFGVSVLALGDTGVLPAASYGSTLLGRARNEVFGLELSASVLAPQWAQVPSVAARKGGNVWWFGGQLGGCWYPARGIDAGACLGLEAGRITGTGENVDRKRTAHALWLAAVPNAALRFPISPRFALEARVGLAVPVLRPEFGLDGYEPFFQPKTVSGRGALGIGFE